VRSLQVAPPRRRHSPDGIERILSEYRDGTSTQREVAERHGICVGTLRNWLRQDRKQSTSPPSHGWLEVIAEAPSPAESYRIELPRGRVLVLGPRWRAGEVRELLSLLTAP